MTLLTPDVCVIGGGSGGLSYAAGAAQFGADVVLLEKGAMGGDCLNFGCVPSKALLAAGKAAASGAKAVKFGVTFAAPQVDYAAVMDHVHDVIGQIAPHDSPERFRELGVNVIERAGVFVDEGTVEAGDITIRAKRFIISTGSSAFIPPIPGLETTPYLTNESIWDQRTLPAHLLVLGGGPIGLEMALAHRRLGAEVTVLERETILAKDDADLVEVARESMIEEGLYIHERTSVTAVSGKEGAIELTAQTADGEEVTFKGTHLLVATGRAPNVNGLGLDAAKIAYSPRGIEVTGRQMTTNARVLAIGDVAQGPQFTHAAGHQASIAIQNTILPRIPFRKVETRNDALPWVTYIDPEIAQVGLSESAARAQGVEVRIERAEFKEADRLVAERATKGFIKVLLDKKDRVVGAGIVGQNAGELIHPWALAVYNKVKITTLASYIAPYPTAGEMGKKVTSKFIAPKLFSPLVKRIVKLWLRCLSRAR